MPAERDEWSRAAAPPIDDPLEMAIAASMVEPSPSTRLEQALPSAHHELEKLLLEQGVRDENLVGQFQEGISRDAFLRSIRHQSMHYGFTC